MTIEVKTMHESQVAKENKDSMIGTIAIMFMALATILSFISIFCKGED